jgi:hypothetical protein
LFFGFVRSIVVWDPVIVDKSIITRNTLEIIKPTLAIVVDNSSSIKALDANKEALEVYAAITSNSALKRV